MGLGLLLSASSLPTKRKNSVFLFFSFVSLLFFHSFVDPFSMYDLPFYYHSYHDLSRMSWSQCLSTQDLQMEIGYRLFMKTASSFSEDFTFFLFVYSAILLALYYFVIRKYSPMVILSVIVLLLTNYNQSLFVIRQHLAVALFFATIPLITKRKLKAYLIVCAIAFFLHKSAIIIVPLYFLYRLEGKKMIWMIIVFSLTLVILFSTWVRIVADELGYMSYVNLDKYEGMNYVSFLMSSSFLFLYIFTMKKMVFKSGLNKIVFIALVLWTVLSLFGVGIAIGRLGLYFSTFAILSLPMSLRKMKSVWLKAIIIIVATALLFYPIFMGSGKLYYKDYRLIWQSPYGI